MNELIKVSTKVDEMLANLGYEKALSESEADKIAKIKSLVYALVTGDEE